MDVVSRGATSLGGAEPDGRPFDLLLANLPYVSEDEWEELAPEIREYEPREALVAGPIPGSRRSRRCSRSSPRSRSRPKVIALEVGAGQGDDVSTLIARRGYTGRWRSRSRPRRASTALVVGR